MEKKEQVYQHIRSDTITKLKEEQFESILQKMKVGIPYREHLRSLAAISNMRD